MASCEFLNRGDYPEIEMQYYPSYLRHQNPHDKLITQHHHAVGGTAPVHYRDNCDYPARKFMHCYCILRHAKHVLGLYFNARDGVILHKYVVRNLELHYKSTKLSTPENVCAHMLIETLYESCIYRNISEICAACDADENNVMILVRDSPIKPITDEKRKNIVLILTSRILREIGCRSDNKIVRKAVNNVFKTTLRNIELAATIAAIVCCVHYRYETTLAGICAVTNANSGTVVNAMKLRNIELPWKPWRGRES